MVVVIHEKMMIKSEYEITSKVMLNCCDQWRRSHNDHPQIFNHSKYFYMDPRITRDLYIPQIRNIATYRNIERYKPTTDFTLYDLKKW